MVNFADALNTKYSILQQQANTAQTVGEAQARLAGAQAGVIPAESASRIALERAQAEEAGGQGGYYRALAGIQPGLAQSEIGLRGAQSGLFGAQTGALQRSITPSPLFDINRINSLFETPGFAAGVSDIPRFNLGTPENYKRGKGKVPGKGDGTKDTQPAMLAPGEAVLNKGAAEHLGRHNIDLLNAIGLSKMGMPGVADNQGQQPGMAAGNQEPSGNVPGYARGSGEIDAQSRYESGFYDTTRPRSSEMGVLNSGPSQSAQGYPAGWSREKPAGYKKGTSDVRGTDTEDNRAKTANKEAKGSSGTDTEDDRAKTYNYKKGTSKVPPRAGKAAPAKPAAKAKEPSLPPGHLAVHPAVLHALLNMPHGGMPAPGSAMPMPFPMPMAAGVGQTPFQGGGNATMLPRQGGGQ